MSYLEALILALVQGITEFLPISSSAHLILAPMLFGWQDQGAAFDIAVHLGTLLAVCFYFRDEIVKICRAWLKSVVRREPPDAEAKFGWFIGIATIPVGIVGLLWHDDIQMYLRSPIIIATMTLIFGIVLWLADRHGGAGKDEHTLTLWAVLLIGCAQAVALIPGTSRSGITITAGLLLGLSRPAAARFSFLMAIPVIALASLNEIRELLEVKSPVEWEVMALGTVVSALSAYLCIRYFLRMLDKISMLPFAIYRVILAAVIFAAFATG